MNAICRPQTQVRAPRAGEAGRTPGGRSEGRSGAARGHRAAERTSDSAWHRGLAPTAVPSSPHARQQSRAAGLASEAPPPPRSSRYAQAAEGPGHSQSPRRPHRQRRRAPWGPCPRRSKTQDPETEQKVPGRKGISGGQEGITEDRNK